MSDISKIVSNLENEYINGTVTKSKYVQESMYEDLQKIDAYSNSKFTSSDKDALGRDKPFFNIVTSATNIWYRATDIDRKDIKVRATKAKHWIPSFLANIILQNWMKEDNFGVFLNWWGWNLAKYGSCVTKWVEKDGKLHREVVDWNKLIVDPIDFYGNPVIEILELTPAQLKRNKSYNQDIVKQLLDTHASRETLGGQNKDNRNNYIKLYEVHGEFDKSCLEDGYEASDNQEDNYSQQMHVISMVVDNDGKTETFSLYSGEEAQNPYYITHLIKEDGMTLSKGAVKSLFEAQWMVNHTAKQIKDQLDLASKLIFQTSDGNFVGQNALSAIETGQILIHEMNAPLTQVGNNSHDIGSLQSFQEQWKAVGNEQAGISEAMQGVTPKSGTAWRQTEAILQESHSLFEVMTENKGLHIEEMLRDYVLPFIKKQLKNSKEITAILEAHDIEKIDKLYVKEEAIKAVKEEVKASLLKGELPTQIDTAQAETDIKAQLQELGNQRFFKPSDISNKTWDELFKDFEWEVEVDVTGESTDAQAHLTTLTTMYANLVQTGDMETARKVMKKILEITQAFSPVELLEMPQAQPTPIPTPQEMPVNTG